MMPELATIYDRDFFRQWGRNNARYVRTARRIAQTLHRRLGFASALDLGAGCGVYADALTKLGVRVVAVDGVRPPEDEAFPMDLRLRDLTEPIEDLKGPFDLTLCLEVAEHIPEDLSAGFLRNVTRFSDLVAISCAPPGQGGTHHVNERPKRYWVGRFAELGFRYDRAATGVLVEEFKNPNLEHNWMGHHISLYRRDPGLGTRPGPALPFS